MANGTIINVYCDESYRLERDRAIGLLRCEPGPLRKQKRSLMQKLLTSQIRVKV